MYLLSKIPNYLKLPNAETILFSPIFIALFLIVDLILIGIPAWVHWNYVKDYTQIKNIWIFILSGVLIGVLLGEGGNLVMIFPYTILMLIYGLFYKKFVWWKVALTSYSAGILLENGLNRAPIQTTTLIWVALFISPYFITKMWENRKKVSLIFILKDLWGTILASVILICLAIYLPPKISPPLILGAFAIPFFVTAIYRFIKLKQYS